MFVVVGKSSRPLHFYETMTIQLKIALTGFVIPHWSQDTASLTIFHVSGMPKTLNMDNSLMPKRCSGIISMLKCPNGVVFHVARRIGR